MDNDIPRRATASREAGAHAEDAPNGDTPPALLATLAHELRNRLGPVRNALYLLRGRAANDDQAAWALDLIDRQVHALNGLIDEIADLSRLMRGVLPTLNDAADLGDVIAAAAAATEPTLGAKRQTLRCSIPPERMVTLGDRARLIQALAAVLRAASSLGLPSSEIQLRMERAGSDAAIDVGDAPVAPEVAPRVDAGDAGTDTGKSPLSVRSGDSVGLALAQRLIRLHGGSLAATLDGTGPVRFAIRLPLASAAAAPVG